MVSDEHGLSLQPGTVIAGRFEVMKCLGSGSMGLVYSCRDREMTGRILAIKVLYPEVAADQVSAARFKHEVFSSYKVSHPNVVRSFEFIRDGDITAYSMEYVEGGVLLDYIQAPERTDINEAIRILIEMCAGVQAIHDAGIVHRDLKPENILITTDGSVKIADFGIARTDQGPKLTEHGGVVGTIDYVSPEYMLESVVDWRSDIYALGILAFELVTGQSPFNADSVYAAMNVRLNTDPAIPSSLRPECTAELDQIILKAMSRDPKTRYQSAAALAADLSLLYTGDAPLKSSVVNVTTAHAQDYHGPTVEVTNPAQMIEEAEAVQGHTAVGEVALSAGGGHVVNFEQTSIVEDSKPTENLNDTETLEPEIIDIATHYHAQAELASNLQLESVISKKQQAMSQNVVTNSASIDTNRLKKLKAESASHYKINFAEKVLISGLIMIAIISGIAGGYYLIHLMFPSNSSAVEDSAVQGVNGS